MIELIPRQPSMTGKQKGELSVLVMNSDKTLYRSEISDAANVNIFE